MFDGTEPRPSFIDRLRARVTDSEYSLAERAVAWAVALAIVVLIFACGVQL